MTPERNIARLRDELERLLPTAARSYIEPVTPVLSLDRQSVARCVDHTELSPVATPEQARTACQVAISAGVAAVCLSPRYVPLAVDLLDGTDVAVCTVVGFPHGTEETAVKAFEARRAASQGAREIDMVIGIGALRAGNFEAVFAELAEVRQSVPLATLKVIIETALLSDEEKVQAAVLAEWAGADFVKTSTGFAGGGATEADVRLLRQAIGSGLKVKASGGIRTAEQAVGMILAGADRLGMSGTLAVLGAIPTEVGQ